MIEFKHIPVLLEEVIAALEIKKEGVYVDCTMGGGGHSSAILSRLSKKGKLIGFDKDDDAISVCKERFSGPQNVTIIKSDFKNSPNITENTSAQCAYIEIYNFTLN